MRGSGQSEEHSDYPDSCSPAVHAPQTRALALRRMRVLLCASLFFAPAAQAALVELVVTGTLEFQTGTNPDLEDPSHFDGASVEYRFRYDDQQMATLFQDGPPNVPGFCVGFGNRECTYSATGSIAVTNRPDGSGDVFETFNALAQSMSVTGPSGYFWTMNLPRPQSGLFSETGFGEVTWQLPSPDPDPFFPLSVADYDELGVFFDFGLLRAPAGSPNGIYSYVMNDVDWSVSTVVPAPAALWLFLGGIASLAGLRRC